MATTITDNGGSIKLTIGTSVRYINKQTIVEITVVKGTHIKIDIGQGALHNIFIPYSDVVSPSTTSVDLLRDAITAYIPNSGGGGTNVGGATEAKQIEQVGLLNTINTSVSTVKNLLTVIDAKVYYEPLMIDDSGAGIVYKGYALPGTHQEAPAWAIERIERIGEVDVHTWANGNRDFTNSWLNREIVTYS